MIRRLPFVALSSSAYLFCNAAWSGNYPAHPVRVIVGFGAGMVAKATPDGYTPHLAGVEPE